MTRPSTLPEPVPPGPGQESAWDYPRPPRLEPVTRRLRVILGGETIAETIRGYRVLETSHPPNYYFPPADVVPGALEAADGASFCEWKGRADYLSALGGDRREVAAAWAYARPSPAFASIRGYVAFYPARMDACFVDDERAVAQPGGFYGGWITDDVVGPFKGASGTRSW
ncbi:MAG TPA: DUF427 domain-containing protein [Acidimicrobiia bacterium]|nr:DUF427 domain-containing protein [Acidimicrobiia bacterium]